MKKMVGPMYFQKAIKEDNKIQIQTFKTSTHPYFLG